MTPTPPPGDLGERGYVFIESQDIRQPHHRLGPAAIAVDFVFFDVAADSVPCDVDRNKSKSIDRYIDIEIKMFNINLLQVNRWRSRHQLELKLLADTIPRFLGGMSFVISYRANVMTLRQSLALQDALFKLFFGNLNKNNPFLWTVSLNFNLGIFANRGKFPYTNSKEGFLIFYKYWIFGGRRSKQQAILKNNFDYYG